MGEDELAPPDVLGSDDDLRSLPERVGSGAEAEGRDPQGVVAVCMRADGRVADVRIDTWWRELLTPSQLQDAVLTAYRQAVAMTVAAAPRGASAGAAPSEEPEPVEGDAAWLDDIRRRLDRTEQTLEHTAALRSGTAGGERVVTGPNGWVTLILNGPAVAGVRIDTRAAMHETPGRLAADILAALQAAA